MITTASHNQKICIYNNKNLHHRNIRKSNNHKIIITKIATTPLAESKNEKYYINIINNIRLLQ